MNGVVKKQEDKQEKCNYTFVKGKNKGNCCNEKPKKNSFYCSKHIKYAKNSCEKTQKQEEKVEKKIQDDIVKKKRITIQRDPHTKKFIHVATQLVFFSKQEPVIYAKLVDGIEKPLTKEDIDLCRIYSFPFDEKKIENLC